MTARRCCRRLARLAFAAFVLLVASAGATVTAAGANFAIRDATLLGAPGAPARATVLVRNGLIAEIGTELAVPAGFAVIDAAGRPLTPGFIVGHSQLGLVEIDGVEETNDIAAGQTRHSAGLAIADALNPYSVLLAVNRADGVTRAAVAPGMTKGGSLIAGQGALISLAGARVPDNGWLLRRESALYVSLAEAGRALAGSRPVAFAQLREAFAEASGDGPRPAAGLSRDAQLGPADLAALRRVLAGELPLVIHAERAADIRAALAFGDDHGITPILLGAAEAWLLAADLASRRVPVLLDPSRNLPARFEALHVRRDAAQRLLQAGVRVAFIDSSEFASHNARNLRQIAGIAVADGLGAAEALAAITLTPAQIFGLDRRLGTIEAGKIADLVLWDGDPLEVTSQPVQVWIDGRAMPPDTRQTLLRERYRPDQRR